MRHAVGPILLAVTAATIAACSTKTDQPAAGGDTAAAATSPAGATGSASSGTPADTSVAHGAAMAGMSDSAHMAGMGNMAPMGGMTGNPDQDFLRMMSDHHKGLIAMAHLSAEGKKGSSSVQADAKKLDTKQDAELDSMTTMLERDFKDPYAPKIMPDNQAMVDQLKGQSGAAYDRAFYQNVVKHHQQAIQMIDQYLPKMQRANLKAMAERMRRDQAREIDEFQRKAAAA